MRLLCPSAPSPAEGKKGGASDADADSKPRRPLYSQRHGRLTE